MSKKLVCPSCDNKGLAPWCPQCLKFGLHTVESRALALKTAREAKYKNRLSHEERHLIEQREEIARFKYLTNTKELKAILRGHLRSRKLLTGIKELDAHINRIVNEVLEQVHAEIDSELLTEIPAVVSRFDKLLNQE